MIDGGAIGAVRYVSVTLRKPLSAAEERGELPWRVDPAIAGGGHFVDLASHTLDFLDYALGPVIDARGGAANQARRYPAEDIVSGTFTFATGVQGVGVWCFSAHDRLARVEIVGSEGRLTFATFDEQPIVLTTGAGTTEYAIAHPPHIQQPLIQTIVDALNGIGACPSTGATAARTSWVMDRMLGR